MFNGKENLKNLGERGFLLRSLMTIFILQFITVFFQVFSCQSIIRNEKELEKITLICSNATNSFNETGKLALATFLALLVPSSSQMKSGSSESKSKEE